METTQIPDKIYEIAHIIRRDWTNMYFGAKPYVDAMADINDIHGNYHNDSARNVVSYFLANAQSWRGNTARAVKAKLNSLLKSKR